MERLHMESPDLIEGNIEKISLLFPEIITEVKDKEGGYRKAIDFDKLKALLTQELATGKESYEFTWPGKREALAEAHQPIRKTLRPCLEESVDWEKAQNLYIEGDNLDVLKLLQESYLNKIKMIYIDPPYNTGNDFIYQDNFVNTKEEYQKSNGSFSDDGERLIRNIETNGRFHSDWCSMIYPRLLLSRNLLTEDGVIFISIDDNEQDNLKKLCDEVFGEQNFVAQLVWERAYAPKNDAKYISNSHEYILFYAKNIDQFTIGRLPRTDKANSAYKNLDNDPRGLWRPDNLSVKTYSAANDYPIITPSGRVVEPPAGRCWSLSKNKFLERLQDNRIWFGVNGDSVPSIKRFLNELKFDGMAPTSILFYKDVGHSQEGSKEVAALLGGGYFDGPKPVRLLKRLMVLANLEPDSIVLDFFSGSASTAQAVMETNLETGSQIRYILVQIPEKCDPQGKAYEAGYRTICEIGQDRIKKVLNKYNNKNPLFQPEGKGFRVLKLDSSNMNDIFYSADHYTQDLLQMAESNIKKDRTGLDLLYGCLVDWGLELTKPIFQKQIFGSDVYIYDDQALVACFSENISEKLIRSIADMKPMRVVFRDECFSDDAIKVNVEEIFKLISPDTEIKVL